MLIGNVMTRHAVTCHADDTLERAAQLMWEHDVGFLPVVDGGGRLIGVVTDRDALMAAYTRGQPLRALRVDGAMARKAVTCSIHDDVTQTEHRMAEHQIRRLPVVDEVGVPIGVVTLSDVARASLHCNELSSQTPTWTLVGIAQHRQTHAS